MEPKQFLKMAIVAAFVLMAGLAVYSWESIVSVTRREASLERSYRIFAETNRLLSYLEDEETGVRGYLITGSPAYLAPYEEAKKRVDSEGVLLKGLTRTNFREQVDLQKITAIALTRMSYFLEAISIRSHDGGVESPELRTMMDLSKEEMDRLRSSLSDLQKEEGRTLTLSHEAQSVRVKQAFGAIVAGYLSAFSILGVAFVFLFRELLAHERSDLENRRLSREYADLYDNAPCGYHSLDPNGLILRINQTELLWMGYRPEEVISRMNYREFLTPASKVAFEEAFARILISGSSRDLELDFVRKDGSVFSVLSNATALRNEKGNLIQTRSVVVDITGRKKDREMILDLNQKLTDHGRELEAMNRDLEGFTYSVSHDLRAPLRAIDGFSRILREDYEAVLGDEGRRLLSIVRENTKQMSQLIEDLLAFSRLGKVPLQKRWVDMTALVNKAILEVAPNNGEKGVVTVDGPIPEAYGDPALLHQVFVNLLSNGVKFSGKGPHPKVRVGGEKGDGEVVFFVSDNGVGFDMQYYKKLFGVFQRLHSQEEFPGTGVGLAIVSRIVSRHGGRVWARGIPGEGATFFFSLPKPIIDDSGGKKDEDTGPREPGGSHERG